MRSRSFCALVFAVALTSVAAAQPTPAGDGPIDAGTRARLDRGALVTSPIDERRGDLRLLGGTSMKVIRFSPSAAWRAIERAPDLGAMLPGDTTVRVTERRGHERSAVVRHAEGFMEVTYRVRLRFQPGERMLVFQLDPSERTRLRAGWGFVRIDPWPGGRALVRFGALVDVGTGLVTGMMRPTLKRAILDVPRTLERHLVRCARAPAGPRCGGR